MKRAVILLAVIAAALVWLALHRRHGAGGRPEQRASILLITVDTLRADRVGRGLTPALDGLASAGMSFTNARATAPLTLPSHVSILTGTIPPVHGVRENGVVFEDGPQTMARALKERGYGTAAFVGAYVLDRRFGLADGFDTYDDRVHRDFEAAARLEAERPANEVVDAALAWLENASPPFFLWVHLYDPHAPYTPPAEFSRDSPYDGEVAFADAQIVRLIAALDRRQLRSSTLIAAAGDHGEGLGDHGEQTHGMLAYDSTLEVPLIVAGPGIARAIVAAPVSLAELAPSLLRHVDAGAAPADASSRHIFTAQLGDADVYAETRYPRTAGWHPLAVLAGERWKLIRSSEVELYDLRADPGETRNLAAERAAIVDGMSARLKSFEAASRNRSETSISPEAAERLRALGYVSGAASSRSISADAPNPARVISSWNIFEDALSQLTGGRARAALPALKALSTRHPEALVFQSTYARALQETGSAGVALAVYREALKRWPDEATLYHDLAVAARAAGDEAEAVRAEQAALALDPGSPAALNGLGLLHVDAGRPGDAVALFERAANADPSNASYWTNLGNARRELGDAGGAEAAYRRALDVAPTYADALNGLGVLLVQQGRAAEAVSRFERALQHAPDLHAARLNLGIAYQESGQREKAAEAYRQLLATRGPGAAPERKAAAELLKQVSR